MYNSHAGRPLIIVMLVGTDIIQIKSFPHYLHFFNMLMYSALMDCPLLSFSHKMLGTICFSAEIKIIGTHLPYFWSCFCFVLMHRPTSYENSLVSLEGQCWFLSHQLSVSERAGMLIINSKTEALVQPSLEQCLWQCWLTTQQSFLDAQMF